MTLSDTDRLELQALLMRYTHILDYGSVDDLDAIWTEDCEFQVDDPPFHMQGLDQIKQTRSRTYAMWSATATSTRRARTPACTPTCRSWMHAR